MIYRILLSLLAATVLLPAASVENATEADAIAILKSDAGPSDKDTACARLKRVGTQASIPALAALLVDEQLSHSARYALESMAAPEAGRALLDAFGKTSGLLRVGIASSLGNRRETAAVQALTAALGKETSPVADACAAALGSIGSSEAARALESALPAAAGSVRTAVIEGLLAVAARRVDQGDTATATRLYDTLLAPTITERIRLAAYAGKIRAAGNGAADLVVRGIRGQDAAEQKAALQLAATLPGTEATRQLAALLPGASLPVRVALLGVLNHRADAAASGAILPYATDADPAVRMAALAALCAAGDGAAIPTLAGAAAQGENPAAQKIARRALATLQGNGVSEALIALLTAGSPALQAEAACALAIRSDTVTVPRLLELARAENASSAAAAFRALAQMADERHLNALVLLVTEARTDAARAMAADTLRAVCMRLRPQTGLDVTALLDGVTRGSAPVRAALLPACGVLPQPTLVAALEAALADVNPIVRTAATEAVCEGVNPDLIPILERLIRKTTDNTTRLQALRGCARLAASDEMAGRPASERIGWAKGVLPLLSSADGQRVALSALGAVPDAASLDVILLLLKDAAIRDEAALAILKIAAVSAWSAPDATAAALKSVAAHPAHQQAAEQRLREMDAIRGYILRWDVAGPYEKEGSAYNILFDTVFPAETNSAKVAWKTVTAGTDPKQPWRVDLLKALGGHARVAYARARIFSPKDQRVRLEIGSDDGNKVWLNGAQVHAANVARAITPGSDKAEGALKKGWNMLLVKVTQNIMGWDLSVRMVPEGGLDGIRMDTGRE